MSSDILSRITIVQGDGLDSASITTTLREQSCDALVTAAGTREPWWREQTLPLLTAAISQAAIEAGRKRNGGRPLRVWFIGGMGSLRLPGTPYQIQDYLPGWLTAHHRGTEEVVKRIPLTELRWSVLCVGMMTSESARMVRESGASVPVGLWDKPRAGPLLVKVGEPPGWESSWPAELPIVGRYLDVVSGIGKHTAEYEDVAAFIAEDLERGHGGVEGCFVGYKPTCT